MDNNNHSVIGGLTGSVISLLGLNYSMSELDSLISIICSVIGLTLAVISFAIPRVINLIKKVRKAREDGKITNDELDEIGQDVTEIANGLNDIINKENKKNDED